MVFKATLVLAIAGLVSCELVQQKLMREKPSKNATAELMAGGVVLNADQVAFENEDQQEKLIDGHEDRAARRRKWSNSINKAIKKAVQAVSSSSSTAAPGTSEGINIYFSGEARMTDQTNASKLLRPDSVKFIRCKGNECSDCPSKAECGWSGTGTVGNSANSQLITQSDIYDSYVAEYWIDCSDGQGDWEVVRNSKITKDWAGNPIKGCKNEEIKVFVVEEGGALEGREVSISSGQKWNIAATDGSTRIRVVIKPVDASKKLMANIKVRGKGVKESVATCMDTKMCLKELDGNDEGDSKLRNDNKEQLQCLQGDLSSDSCTRWTACLDQHEVDKAMLLAILQASLPTGALHQGAASNAGSSANSDDEITGACLHPATDDPESWECECSESLEDACGSDSVCIQEQLCDAPKVCQDWKDNWGDCDSVLLAGNASTEINAEAPSLDEKPNGEALVLRLLGELHNMQAPATDATGRMPAACMSMSVPSIPLRAARGWRYEPLSVYRHSEES